MVFWDVGCAPMKQWGTIRALTLLAHHLSVAHCAHTTTQVLNPSRIFKVLHGLALANLLRSFFLHEPFCVV